MADKPKYGPPDAATLSRHAAIREHALTYPEAWEDFPWGETAVKVRKKAFVFLFASDTGVSVTMKLPTSHEAVLMFPFAEPTGYGLGKSGWVSAKFAPDAEFPLPLVLEWVDESYRAIAPKTLIKTLS